MTDNKETNKEIETEKKKDNTENIVKLKAELFDIIRKQEQLMVEFNSLNDVKARKVRELQELESPG